MKISNFLRTVHIISQIAPIFARPTHKQQIDYYKKSENNLDAETRHMLDEWARQEFIPSTILRPAPGYAQRIAAYKKTIKRNRFF